MSPLPHRVRYLCDPVLKDLGVRHGFGLRGSQVPERTCFARQVHGAAVWREPVWAAPSRPEADAVLGLAPDASVGVVTADCVPILAAAADGSAVVAIHAGWRGLASGVIESGIEALRSVSGGQPIAAAIGPAARGCCYEVDDPVRTALAERHDRELDSEVLRPGRAGHFFLDLPLLAERVLLRNGVDEKGLGTLHRVCTICDPDRFESFRRDGAGAGRLEHFIARGTGPESRG